MKLAILLFLSAITFRVDNICEKRAEFWMEGFNMALFDLGTEVGSVCGSYGQESDECRIAEQIYIGVYDMKKLEERRFPDVGGIQCRVVNKR